MKRQGYVIAKNKSAATYFTSQSSYDYPSWKEVHEATIYPTVEMAHAAASKLWKYGHYSASVQYLNETGDEEKLNDLKDKMVSGDKDADFTLDVTNFSDDHEEEIDPEMDDEDLDDEEMDDEDQDELDDEDLDDEDQDELDDEDLDNNVKDEDLDDDGDLKDLDLDSEEENEVSFETPIEKDMRTGRKSTMPTGNGPQKMSEAVNSNYRSTQSNVPLFKSKNASKGVNKGTGNAGPVKLSNAEVCEMRTMYEQQNATKQEIYDKWPNMSRQYIDQILRYELRLSPACDPKPLKESGIPTDVTTITYHQQVNEPADVNYANEIGNMHDEHKTPNDILMSLRQAITEFQTVYDYNVGKDDSQASMALTIVSAMKDLLDDLSVGTVEGLTQAQIRLTTFMGPILSNLPYDVKDYLYKRGRQPIKLKNIFYDKWDKLKSN